jgi:hypothetical protein
MKCLYMPSYKTTGFLLCVMIGCAGATQSFGMDGQPPTRQPETQQDLHTTSPTPTSQYMNVEGKLKEIQGDLYILEGTSDDQSIRVQVGKDTAFPNGPKELGESVQALVSAKNGHALIIR